MAGKPAPVYMMHHNDYLSLYIDNATFLTDIVKARSTSMLPFMRIPHSSFLIPH